MSTVQTKIWRALKARVETIPMTYAKAYLGADFEKPTASGAPAPYLDIQHAPNTSVRLLIGSDGPHDRPGVLQIALMYPIALKHSEDVMLEKAGLIAAHFPTDLRMAFDDVTVRVEKAADVIQAYREDAYWRWPVVVRYYCYA